jgi:hypothetical protein
MVLQAVKQAHKVVIAMPRYNCADDFAIRVPFSLSDSQCECVPTIRCFVKEVDYNGEKIKRKEYVV